MRLQLSLAISLVAILGLGAHTEAQKITTFDLPGSTYTIALSINDGGTIVGYYIDASHVSHGFERSADGTFTIIDAPNGVNTDAFSNNRKGAVTGFYYDANYQIVPRQNSTLARYLPNQ